MTKLNRDEHHLLDWLGKEPTSALGECKGLALASLLDLKLAAVVAVDSRGHDYDRIALTPAGSGLLDQLGPWQPGSAAK